MKCPVCKKPADSLRAGIKGGQYITERCDVCFGSAVNFAAYARKYNRDRQKEDYRKDILQAWEGDKPDRDFIRAYPEVAQGRFTEEELHKYG